MGFGAGPITRAIAASGCTTLDAALEYLVKDEEGWRHPFEPNAECPLVCSGCGDPQGEHAALVGTGP